MNEDEISSYKESAGLSQSLACCCQISHVCSLGIKHSYFPFPQHMKNGGYTVN